MHEQWMGVWQSTHVADESELQTDVMRFMAILAFCLVAIFALVQSMPLTPVVQKERVTPVFKIETTPAATIEPASTASPVRKSTPPVISGKRANQAVRIPDITLQRRRVFSRAPERSKPRSVPVVPTTSETESSSEDDGLSLRFASDDVLKNLVRTRTVALYAMEDGDFRVLDADKQAVSFIPVSAPGSYHEMIEATVPADVRAAVPGTVTWGVTLPVGMTQTLQRLADAGSSGVLVITADARVELERDR